VFITTFEKFSHFIFYFYGQCRKDTVFFFPFDFYLSVTVTLLSERIYLFDSRSVIWDLVFVPSGCFFVQ